MRSDMEFWKEVRREVLTNELSRRAACRKYGLGWHTLTKILAHAEPPGYRLRQPRKKRKLGAYLPIIEQMLEADREAPQKQCHTVRRTFERLQQFFNEYPGNVFEKCAAFVRVMLAGNEFLFVE